MVSTDTRTYLAMIEEMCRSRQFHVDQYRLQNDKSKYSFVLCKCSRQGVSDDCSSNNNRTKRNLMNKIKDFFFKVAKITLKKSEDPI